MDWQKVKEMFNSFNLNVTTVRFQPKVQKLELLYTEWWTAMVPRINKFMY